MMTANTEHSDKNIVLFIQILRIRSTMCCFYKEDTKAQSGYKHADS